MGKEKSENTIWDNRIGKWIVSIGSVLSVLFGVFGTYMYFKKDVPNLEVIIESEIRLFNNQDKLPKLQVLIDSVDLLSNEKNISIYTVRVTNNGTKNISLYDYDTGDIGLNILDGSVIEVPSVVDASSVYLNNKAKNELRLLGDNIIILPHTILNIGDSYLLHFCVIHDKYHIPTFKSFGQIVGQKTIDVTNESSVELTGWEKATKGSLNVQLVRFFVYGISLVLFVLIIIVLCYWLSLLYKIIKKIVFFRRVRQRGIQDFVVNDYRRNGYKNIYLAYIIKDIDENHLTECYNRAKDYLKENKPDENNSRLWQVSTDRIRVYTEMVRIGYLIMHSDGKVCQAKSSLYSVTTMYDMLKRYKYIDFKNLGLGHGVWEHSVMLGDYSEFE